jgi:hypothetical protein
MIKSTSSAHPKTKEKGTKMNKYDAPNNAYAVNTNGHGTETRTLFMNLLKEWKQENAPTPPADLKDAKLCAFGN